MKTKVRQCDFTQSKSSKNDCKIDSGLAVMVLMIPINSVVGDKMKAYQKEQMANKDIRTKLMDEVLNGIKVMS